MTSVTVTVGPAIAAPEILGELMRREVSAFRFSGSKYTVAELNAMAVTVADAAYAAGRSVDLLLDLPGSKTRLTNDGGFPLKGADRVRVAFGPAPARRDLPLPEIGMTGPPLGALIEVGDVLVLGDGENALRVEACFADHCIAIPLTTGELGRRKGVRIQGKRQAYQSLRPQDETVLQSFGEMAFTGVIVSFVEHAGVVERVRSLIGEGGSAGSRPAVIAKVETRVGAQNAAAVAETADALLLGRGDLLLDAGEPDFYNLGEAVITAGQKAGRAVIVGTELLPSLSETWLPHRSELAYLCHLIDKDVDGLMLAKETTIGKQPLRTVDLINTLIRHYGREPGSSVLDRAAARTGAEVHP